MNVESINSILTIDDEPFIRIVFRDQAMPHMTGVDMARRLLAWEPHILVIFCSGYSGNFNVKKTGAAGIKRFLMKPFTVGEPSKTIQGVLS